MSIVLYNSLTKTKEDLKPVSSRSVSMYNCGPTVYQYAHIGNMRSFMLGDVLRRVLEFNGSVVKQVMNITDVGHLTGDGDEGDDKLEKSAKTEGKTAWDIAKFYADAFLADYDALNMLRPHEMPRATDHIQEQIAAISKIEKRGFTYKTSDGIYFDTQKYGQYGVLSNQSIDEKKSGTRVVVSTEKKNPADFALWKFSPDTILNQGTKEFTPSIARRDMEWESPWGRGFPGWHIECSAMSRKFLGQPFDIHTGGVDHIAVHHENEIAQSCAAYDAPLANVWLHGEFLLIDSQKMSKSLGNIYTVKTVVEKGFDPLDLRMLYLMAHYRSQMNFTWDSLAQACENRKTIQNLGSRISDLESKNTQYTFEIDSYVEKFKEALNDDLNTPEALAVVFVFVTDVNKWLDEGNTKIDTIYEALRQFDSVLGLHILESEAIPEEVIKKAQKRDVLREAKKFAEADVIRGELESLGYEVRDEGKRTKVIKK